MSIPITRGQIISLFSLATDLPTDTTFELEFSNANNPLIVLAESPYGQRVVALNPAGGRSDLPARHEPLSPVETGETHEGRP